jgi:hypothetical protein
MEPVTVTTIMVVTFAVAFTTWWVVRTWGEDLNG